MNGADVVYNYPRTLEKELEKLGSNSLGRENSEAILRFYRLLVAEGLGLARQIKYLWTLRRIAMLLNKPFKEVTKDDMIDFIAKIERQEYSEWTKRDYKIIVKKFYKWLRSCEDDYPPEVRWIKTGHNVPNGLQKKDLLTIDEVERIADHASEIRDKAFIWVYFESMRRLGEILTLKVGDVEFDELGARLAVNGKMGRDYGRVITSVPILSTWLNMHPSKDDPKAPLWVSLASKNVVKQLSYSAARSMLRDCVQRAGIKKRVWLYLIRHSRITPASKILPHALLCATAGWKQGSRMPSVYIHLAGEDVDEAQCILSGTARTESKEEQLRPQVCERCHTNNLPGSKFCSSCGLCLDVAVAVQLDDARSRADKLVTELVKNPEVLNNLLKGIDNIRDEHNDLSSNIEIVNDGDGSRDKKVQERKD